MAIRFLLSFERNIHSFRFNSFDGIYYGFQVDSNTRIQIVVSQLRHQNSTVVVDFIRREKQLTAYHTYTHTHTRDFHPHSHPCIIDHLKNQIEKSHHQVRTKRHFSQLLVFNFQLKTIRVIELMLHLGWHRIQQKITPVSSIFQLQCSF